VAEEAAVVDLAILSALDLPARAHLAHTALVEVEVEAEVVALVPGHVEEVLKLDRSLDVEVADGIEIGSSLDPSLEAAVVHECQTRSSEVIPVLARHAVILASSP
jgi:hypothetical protein